MKRFIFISHNTRNSFMILTIGGIITGIICGVKMQQQELNYCTSLIHNLLTLPGDSFQYFVQQSLINLLFLLILFFTGFSLIGIPVILLLLFLKGFKLGLNCFLFIYLYQFKGIVGFMLTYAPVMMIDFASVFIVASTALHLSCRLIDCLHDGTKKQGILPFINIKCNRFLVSLGLCFVMTGFKSTVGLWLIELFHRIL